MAEDNTPTNVVDDFKLSGTMGGNTTPTGNNIAYANVEDLEQFIQFDRKAEGNIEKINEIKKIISSKGYLYDSAYDGGVVFGVTVDELGNVQIAEGNHRLQALIDFARETGQEIYVPINPVLTSTGSGNKVQLTNTDNAYNSMKQLLTDMLEGNKNFDLEYTIKTKLGEPGRRIVGLDSYTYPGGSPGTSTNQSNIKKFFNSIGLNTITYDELPDNSIYKTGVNTFTDTPTNVVPESPIVFAPDITGEAYDEIEDLLLDLRDKYADVLDIGQDGDPALYFDVQPGITEEMKGVHINFELIEVSPEHQNKGIGTEILNEVKKIATKHKIPISATAADTSPTGFFAKQGFLSGEDMVWIPDSIDPKYIVEKSGGSLGAAKLNDPLVFDSWVDNYAKTTTSFVDNLPLVKPVKDLFLNAADNRLKRLAGQVATPGGILDAVDIWEIGVLSLVAGAIAYNEIDEIPKITKNAILRTYNLSQGRPIDAPLRIIGLPEIKISEYDIDFEYAMETLERGEKVMPTDIIIKELAKSSLEKGEPAVLPGTGVTATTGAKQQFEPYGEELAKRAKKTVNMKRDEVKQDLLESKGVQEEKMFEQAKPKKRKPTGGAGAKIL